VKYFSPIASDKVIHHKDYFKQFPFFDDEFFRCSQFEVERAVASIITEEIEDAETMDKIKGSELLLQTAVLDK
jgi:hypothetical protein